MNTALSLSKFISVAIATALVFSLLQFGFLSADVIPNFPFNEITAQIQNISPADNESYAGAVPLTISVRFSAFSKTQNADLIPYQKINCIYRLDNGEWKNVSLSEASEQTSFGDPILKGYWNDVYCNYSATLQGLSNGVHLLDINLEPVGERVRLSSNGKNLFAYPDTQNNHSLPSNSSIIFYVSGNENGPTPTDQPTNTQHEPFLTIVAVSIAVIVAMSVLVYCKKTQASELMSLCLSYV